MSASLREQILARVAAVLAAAGTPAGANVFRAREVGITRGVSPAITVLYGGGRATTRAGMSVDKHEITIKVVIFVRGDPWDTLADAVDVPAHQALLADATLKGMGVELLREADVVESQEADRTAGALEVSYLAKFMTRSTDIALPA